MCGEYKVCLAYAYRQHNTPPGSGLQQTTNTFATKELLIKYIYYSILQTNSQV